MSLKERRIDTIIDSICTKCHCIPGSACSDARKGAVENAKTMTRKSKMTVGEASQVLNLPANELRHEKIAEVRLVVIHHFH